MKAAVFHRPGEKLTIEEVRIDNPGPREVLIRTAAVGLCHSDLHYIDGLYTVNTPAILGHEAAGIVEKVGADVTALRPGDHVITCLSVFCGHCDYCTTGLPFSCDHQHETRRGATEEPRLSLGGRPVHHFYDLAGFAVGAVEKSKILTGQNVQAGDVVLGLASSGVHSNGFSLVRKCIERAGANIPDALDGKPFKQALMEPTRLYVLNVLAALAVHPIKALAHITGGGLLENIPRVLPDGLAAHLNKGSWPQTELFAWLQKTAGIDDTEMNRTFNNGIGMVVVIDATQADACAQTLREAGEQVYVIGKIAAQGATAQVVVA